MGLDSKGVISRFPCEGQRSRLHDFGHVVSEASRSPWENLGNIFAFWSIIKSFQSSKVSVRQTNVTNHIVQELADFYLTKKVPQPLSNKNVCQGQRSLETQFLRFSSGGRGLQPHPKYAQN